LRANALQIDQLQANYILTNIRSNDQIHMFYFNVFEMLACSK